DVEELRHDPSLASGYRETPRLSIYYVALNRSRPPLDDPALRRRLVKALDVPAIVRRTLRSGAIPANGIIPPGLLGHRPSPMSSGAAPMDDLDLDLDLSAGILPIYLGQYAAVADEVIAAFKRKGVRLNITTRNRDEFLVAEEDATVDVTLGRWVADYPDSDTFAYGLVHSVAGGVGRLVGTPSLDRIIEEARSELDPQSRHAMYRQIEETLARDAVIIPLFHEQVYRFARPEVEGLSLNFSLPEVAYDTIRITR
ncbi:MAG TPA: ABC transporter substrate-binding protein, partial [Thermoanaerobaculia bacterium]|nr:ABC transporter substrate-binding protein [Thermoanaerobaculia bacterium]